MKGQKQIIIEETVIHTVEKIFQMTEPDLAKIVNSSSFSNVGDNDHINNKIELIIKSLNSISAIPRYNFIDMVDYAKCHQSNIAKIIVIIDYYDDISRIESLREIFDIKPLLVNDKSKYKYHEACNKLYLERIGTADEINDITAILTGCPESYTAYSKGIEKLTAEYEIIASKLTKKEQILDFLADIINHHIRIIDNGAGYAFIRKYHKKCYSIDIEQCSSRNELLRIRDKVFLEGYSDLIAVCNQKIEESVNKDIDKELSDEEMVELYKCITDPVEKATFLSKCLSSFKSDSLYFGFIYQKLLTDISNTPKKNLDILLAKDKLITSFQKLSKHKNLDQICEIVDRVANLDSYDKVFGLITSNDSSISILYKCIKNADKNELTKALASFRLCDEVKIYDQILERFFDLEPQISEISFFANELLLTERFFPNITNHFNELLDDFLENKARNSNDTTELQLIFQFIKDNCYCPKAKTCIIQKLFLIDSN